MYIILLMFLTIWEVFVSIKTMITKENEVNEVAIEHIQPKKCCIHPHEWCNQSPEFIEYEKQVEKKKEFWKSKIKELNNFKSN